MIAKTCELCGREFMAKRGTAKFCTSNCRQRSFQAAKAAAPELVRAPSVPPLRREGAAIVALPAVAPDSAESLADVTRTDLESADRLRTPAGLLAVKLAQILDSGRQDTGSSIAALGRQYLATLAQALDGAEKAADPLDEILNRRRSA